MLLMEEIESRAVEPLGVLGQLAEQYGMCWRMQSGELQKHSSVQLRLVLVHALRAAIAAPFLASVNSKRDFLVNSVPN